MDSRTEEIIRRFEKSWLETQSFFLDLSENHEGFEFVNPILDLISTMKEAGEWKNFRAGTSMHTLVISRSIDHRIREDQKEIRIEWINNLPGAFEYEVIMRQGRNKYREYIIRNLKDEKVLNLFKTLKRTIVD